VYRWLAARSMTPRRSTLNLSLMPPP
jgi:hypothetical protein